MRGLTKETVKKIWHAENTRQKSDCHQQVEILLQESIK